jgi:hypothetical protein
MRRQSLVRQKILKNFAPSRIFLCRATRLFLSLSIYTPRC